MLIAVPKVIDLIGHYRARYTQDGGSTPPHVTLLQPFFAPSEVTPTVRRRIQRVVGAVPAFSSAAWVATFASGVLYLEVERAAPFVDLITLLRDEFRETAPYGARSMGSPRTSRSRMLR